MKKTILALVCLLTTVTTASAQACYEVVPLPQSIQMQKGEPFVLDGSVQILVQDGLQNEADAGHQRETGEEGKIYRTRRLTQGGRT